MLTSVVLFIGTAGAVSHEWGAATGGHASVGLRTRLSVLGAEGAIVYRLRGQGPSALQIEAHDLWSSSPSGSEHLLGLKLGWSRDWGTDRASRHPYTLVSLGGHVSDVLPVLPTLWLEAGVDLAGEDRNWRVGPLLYGLPPFFVGGGLRVTVTVGGL
jgi:hypothetical protein